MKILILGATGMLGHCALKELSKKHEVYATVRRSSKPHLAGLSEDQVVTNIDATNLSALNSVLNCIKPNLVINCIGVIKQLKESNDPITSIGLNALFPHQLAKLCAEYKCRMIHMSTDCVFDGVKGSYTEDENPNATDLYGQTKAMGEVKNQTHVLTIRTSIIGRELESKHSLIDWFLSQKGKTIQGYSKAIYTGVTTKELCRIINSVVIPNQELHGLYHVSSKPIDKFSLLTMIRDRFKLDITIGKDESYAIDRSLKSDRFREKTNYTVSSWNTMIEDLDINS